MIMIELKHLRKEYPNVCPLKDVNAVINNGEVISIIGPSGTGKSTLLRSINLLETPTSGSIVFNGEDITDEKCNIDLVRQRIGMVFQSYNLYAHLTVLENVMLAQTLLLKKSKEEAALRSMELLRKVGMEDKALNYPSELSGGQKQRAAIARTLAMEPEVILFDEPTSALDPLMVGEVEKVIEELASEGRTMMIVTHSMSLAKRISTRIFYMDEGGIYEDGTPEQIFKYPRKPKTREFVFNEDNMTIRIPNNLTIRVPYGDFDLDAAFEKITGFVYRHSLDSKTQHKLNTVFEEFCMTLLHSVQKEGEIIRASISYNENEKDVYFSVAHNVSGISKESEKDPVAMGMLCKTAEYLGRVELTDDSEGATREIRARIQK